MDDQVFADGIGQISVIGGLVRIDFVAYSPVEKDTRGQPAAVFRQRLILGMEAFNQAAAKMREAADALASRAAGGQQPRTDVPEKIVEQQHPAPEPVVVSPPAVEAPKPPPKPPFP
ncbi:MAG TPA: hypothetical protein VMU01_14290 [Rhizomicrobium sp.]|nr:hypothetical protein [Rhizomicrobium sp.]